MAFRAGTIALIGRPNAGKSTLLNQVLGGKLAITSAKPQTTRNRIAGVFTDETMQAVFIDTPGIHAAWTELNKRMVEAALSSLSEVDGALWLVDVMQVASDLERFEGDLHSDDAFIADKLQEYGVPIFLVVNKMDIAQRDAALPVIDAFRRRVDFVEVVPVSALKGENTDRLLSLVRDRLLPEHPPLYPEEHWTDLTEKFLVAELIREKIFRLTEQEVPYATHVEVERFDEEQRETHSMVRIFARITVERGSQKAIVIGKGGAMIKRIGELSRKDIEKILGCRVYLDLHVSVEKDWSKSSRGLKKVGF